MEIVYEDMFKVCKDGDAICVTTNGEIKKNGCLVMGKGIAETFRDSFKGIDRKLAIYVSKYGNRAFNVGNALICLNPFLSKTVRIFSFPTKYQWKDNSDLNLIKTSAKQLVELTNKFNVKGNVYLPAPGCSNGHLDWNSQVKPAIADILADNKYKICFLHKKR